MAFFFFSNKQTNGQSTPVVTGQSSTVFTQGEDPSSAGYLEKSVDYINTTLDHKV